MSERIDFSDEAALEKISARIRYSYVRMGGRGDPDDCVQEILMRMLAGKHQHSTVDQCVIDYLRVKSGRKGSAGFADRVALENARSFEPAELDAAGRASDSADLGHRHDSSSLGRRLPRNERIVFTLTTTWGLSAVEVADIFGVSESRVCQWLKGIQSRLQSRIAAQESRIRRTGEGQVAGIRGEKEGRDQWRMESFQDCSLEKGEPGSLESFSTASF